MSFDRIPLANLITYLCLKGLLYVSEEKFTTVVVLSSHLSTTVEFCPMVFSIISNLALLLPAWRAWSYNRLLRSFVYFVETFVSALYHLCDDYAICAGPFSALHHFDFFYAQSFIVINTYYLIHFSARYEWVEWIMIFISFFAIAWLQVLFPGSLPIQAGIAVSAFFILVMYWLIWGMPRYRWDKFTIGLGLLSMAVIFYVFQNLYSPWYDWIHGLWHIAAALGTDYIIQTRQPALSWQNAANRIEKKHGSETFYYHSLARI